MKKILLTILICLVTITIKAQTESKNENIKAIIEHKVDSSLVLSLDSTIKTLYGVISGEKGVERNWKQFKYLFKPDAKLIPSIKDKEGVFKVRFLSPGDYIKSSGNWLVENGFFEKEIHRKIETFGNITQVFSTYESFKSEADAEPFMRGINSIQLLNDGKRWWIINIYWTQETPQNPIPKKYLK
ncbi:hypothetical protein SAMN05428642_104244 [Flaviramulus basaltis]|uniref:SnoaL-like domain-containing protein n=1 Tax=Flaviramulus basaltis TaxID=369401 RepID=A0A1K2IQ92_9FLAO|nr:hypothetical protein [Flaviramulus basaltis]SFZ94551.1 hypothetical protein SAMN05428642_104244 [Flaviramulus basaltis]